MNAYILDFGSRSFAAFSSAPQVGDVILADDEERVRRLFEFLSREITQRRAKLAPYGGSFSRYCQHANDLPTLLVVINGIAAFLEAYPAQEDALLALVRESSQVGICVVVTAESTGSIRMRLRNNFRQYVTCELVDPSDYVMLFGTAKGLPAPHGRGRGLCRVDDQVLEFQAASVCAQDASEYEFIGSMCLELSSRTKLRAAKIPFAPKCVTARMLLNKAVPEASLPYGIFDDELTAACFDFAESPLARMAGVKKKTVSKFAGALAEATAIRPGWNVAVLDMSGMFDKAPAACQLYTKDDGEAAEFLQAVANGYTALGNTLVIVSGIMDFINRAGFEKSGSIKSALKGLSSGGGVYFLLCDTAADTSFAFEDWFKAHSTNKEGLWVGGGIDGQSCITTSYSSKFLKDNKMAGKGYIVEGGNARLVHLVSNEESQHAGREGE